MAMRKPKRRIKKVDGSVSTMTAKGLVQNKGVMKNLTNKQVNARLKQALKNERAYNTQALNKTKARLRAGVILGSQGIASSTVKANNQALIDGGAEPTSRETEEERKTGTDYEGRWYIE